MFSSSSAEQPAQPTEPPAAPAAPAAPASEPQVSTTFKASICISQFMTLNFVLS